MKRWASFGMLFEQFPWCRYPTVVAGLGFVAWFLDLFARKGPIVS